MDSTRSRPFTTLRLLLVLAFLSAAFSVACGLALASKGDYDPSLINIHKYSGIGVAANGDIFVSCVSTELGVQVFDSPHVVAVSDRFAVEGSGFHGEADANHVLLGDQPAFVLAASHW